MTIKIKNNEVAVDQNYEWLPMETCPRGVKVQLLSRGRIACYGHYTGTKDRGWLAWAPLPSIPEWLKDRR